MNKLKTLSTDRFTVQDVVKGVNATEMMADSTIVAGAKVMCTCSGECESSSVMIAKGS